MLQAGEWNIEAAIEYYYSSGITQQQSAQSRADLASQDALLALYNRYKDEHADMILADGMGRFCEDLQACIAAIRMKRPILLEPCHMCRTHCHCRCLRLAAACPQCVRHI